MRTMIPLVNLKGRFGVLVMLGLLFCTRAGLAATVSLGEINGEPGKSLTVLLSIQDTPIDEFGGFSLELDLTFDPNFLSIESVSEGNLKIPAGFYFLAPELLPDPSIPGLTKLIVDGSFQDVNSLPASPGSGSLAALEIKILDQVIAGEQSALGLVLVSSNPSGASGAVLESDSIPVTTVVPLPAAFWFMLGGLGMLAGTVRRRAAL